MQLTAPLNEIIRSEGAFAHAQNELARTVLAETEVLHALRRAQGW